MTTNIKKYIKSSVVALALVATVPALPAAADTAKPATPPQCTSGGNSISFFPAWYDNGLCKNGEIISPSSFDKKDTAASFSKWLTILAMNLVSMLLVAVGYVSLGFIIYGGFKYMTSGDNSSGMSAARTTITNAVVGLIISILSVAIVKFAAAAVGG